MRNFKITALYINDGLIGYFKSTRLACRYAAALGYSASTLERYKQTKNARIIQEDVTAIEKGAKIIESLTEVE